MMLNYSGAAWAVASYKLQADKSLRASEPSQEASTCDIYNGQQAVSMTCKCEFGERMKNPNHSITDHLIKLTSSKPNAQLKKNRSRVLE